MAICNPLAGSGDDDRVHCARDSFAGGLMPQSAACSASAALNTSVGLHGDKLEAQKQWEFSPCGAEPVATLARGSLEFFRAIRAHRYQTYGPWFDSMMRFDSYRDKDVLEIGVGLGSDHFRFARNQNRMSA